ncbi:hypothetical protein AOLI_G00091090 [Acnodon oligacanthus]
MVLRASISGLSGLSVWIPSACLPACAITSPPVIINAAMETALLRAAATSGLMLQWADPRRASEALLLCTWSILLKTRRAVQCGKITPALPQGQRHGTVAYPPAAVSSV